MRRRAGAAARLVGGVLLLAAVAAWVGPGALLDGVRGLGPGALLAALAIGTLTTVCSAWRWRVVAGALGVGLPLRAATAAYYRSQFLNSTLPGGVVGDVHRGVRHGLDAGDLGTGVRAVVWERVAGQVVQVALTAAVLLAVPSPVRGAVPGVVLAGAGVVAVLLVLGRGAVRRGPARVARTLRAVAAQGRHVLLRPPALGPVVVASVLAVAGHVTLFAVAARAAGVSTPFPRLLPLALVVLLAAAVPLSVAGWGPREGAAAAVFAAAGPGAASGAATATAFGVLALVSVLPGALVLLAGRRPPPASPAPAAGPSPVVTAGIPQNGAPHG
ncbi:lysylphosphatidylglycerol synthase transmembrane domain-containing protein [Trujillonella humicola]|uniref:lysylphosphatidylglycerol synthase transmembrane domain-containing protein n=1 Tax=Trujillonella humicola TaxID=3383699 RepID=UPI003906BFB8